MEDLEGCSPIKRRSTSKSSSPCLARITKCSFLLEFLGHSALSATSAEFEPCRHKLLSTNVTDVTAFAVVLLGVADITKLEVTMCCLSDYIHHVCLFMFVIQNGRIFAIYPSIQQIWALPINDHQESSAKLDVKCPKFKMGLSVLVVIVGYFMVLSEAGRVATTMIRLSKIS